MFGAPSNKQIPMFSEYLKVGEKNINAVVETPFDEIIAKNFRSLGKDVDIHVRRLEAPNMHSQK
jgi:hypothetical protein